MVPAMDPAARQIGPYELKEVLGQGGMGVVYRARQRPLGRDVALKLLARANLREPAQLVRFDREMRLAATFSHPGLVRVLDGGVIDGQPFIAMERILGEDLGTVLGRAGRVSWKLAIAIGARVADALTCLHEHGVLHRDVKPANVMLETRGASCAAVEDGGGDGKGDGSTVETVGSDRIQPPPRGQKPRPRSDPQAPDGCGAVGRSIISN